MKKMFSKQVAISGVLAALLMMPAAAVEVYNGDNGKLDVYGSIRGYMGYGDDVTNTLSSDSGYLIGIQNNSQFGVRYQNGAFKANVEYGGMEPGIDGTNASTGFRQYWGSYDSSFGTILFGKTNTPTIDDGFTNDFFNNDNGSQGFGGIATGKRLIQIQYMISGFKLALIEDVTARGRNMTPATPNQESPRIAASYTISGNKAPLFKVAATYKRYNSDSIATNVPSGTSAYHAWVGFRPTFGSSFLSLMAVYGKNGHLYGEQTTTASFGGYQHAQGNVAGLNAQRASVRAEFGTNFTKDFGLIIGAGYQATFKGDAQEVANAGTISSYSAFVQLPYKVSNNFTFAPQVAYYESKGVVATGNTDNPLALSSNGKQSGVVAAARFKWDF